MERGVPGARPIRVLLVDDVEDARLTGARALRIDSIDVREASDVADAVRIVREWDPDVLVADMLFPSGSGLDVIREFRKARPGDRGVVVVTSVVSDFATKLESMRAGADAYVVKPIDWDALARRICALLEQGASERARRILVVEDDPIDATTIRAILGARGYQVLLCTEPDTFGDDLEGFHPDLIVLDANLPFASGYELAQFARQQEFHSATPIVFLSADDSRDARIEAIASGGDHHLSKPVDANELYAIIESRLRRSDSLTTLLERDSLTGLLSRAVIMARASEAVQQKRRNPERSFALAILDIDHFKRVNDSHGHVTGDKVLAAFAAHLRSGLRSTDTIGRYGGEEFVVVMPDSDSRSARAVLQRILERFSQVDHSSDDGVRFRVTFSGGVAALEPGWSLEEWKIQADHLLYEAKAAGRCQIRAPESTPPSVPIDHPSLAIDLSVIEGLRELGLRSRTDLLGEIVEMFSRLAPERMSDLRSALDANDAPAVTKVAHALRSSSGNLGARTLMRLCATIEGSAREGNLAPRHEWMEQLETEVAKAIAALTVLQRETPR